MQVPFQFLWTPATPGEVLNGEPFTSALADIGNKLLFSLITAGLAEMGGTYTRLTGRSGSKPLWVRGLAITADHGVTVSVAFKGSDNNVYPLWTTYGAGGGNGGHSQTFQGDGIYVPRNLRIQITAGSDANNATVFHVAGHVEIEEVPA